MADSRQLVLGIDVGGTKVLAGAVDEGGRVLGRGKVKSPFRGGPEEMTGALVAAADAALAEAGARRADVAALGLGVPGPLDAERTTLLRAMNLGVERWPVAASLEPHFPGVPKRLENDVRAAALGEARFGAAKGERLVVAIWVGTGIGGAVLLDGDLWLGRNRNAGEIGQSFVDLKKAGSFDGTLEGIGAKVGMTAFLRRRIERGEKTVVARAVLEKDGRLKGSEVRKALAAGDALVERALARSARAVGVAIGTLWNVFSPDLFVLGGGIAEDVGEPYVEQVRAAAGRYAFFTDLAEVRVVRSALGDDAGILGGAVLAREGHRSRG
ncbi:MAG TPA: ROK family protein [Thermoanaerobaculia bacterium]|nr:ROK family protein [Thermoanaerobaculia bacterium]